MVHFLLNDNTVATDLPPGMTLLDFIRYQQHLTGTKIGCREGDCGACTVLVGDIRNDAMHYTSATSCLMPLGNAHGKHIVTIEGINTAELNPIQQAVADEGATQCGFCTPGFIMSLAGFCLSGKDPASVLTSIDGNICRCTGYKSIERAAEKIAGQLSERREEDPVAFVTAKKILPSYFSGVGEKLQALRSRTNGKGAEKEALYFVGGGTDLYVQKHEEVKDAGMHLLFDQPSLNGISVEGNRCIIGPSATVTDMRESPWMLRTFPLLEQYIRLVSSTPIRNMATIAGNFINASPIGDFTIFFLALDAQLELGDTIDQEKKRTLPLRKLYKGYKQLDKSSTEYIRKIWFEWPQSPTRFHFEKVSKRTNLDIASVNSAIQLTMKGDTILKAGVSAGGVGPVPLFLQKTSDFLQGKHIEEGLISEAIGVVQSEIAPISDARGSAAYKSLLLGQLIKAHFLQLFPELNAETILMS